MEGKSEGVEQRAYSEDNPSGPGTKTQPRPNISTEHQKEGDARRPRDVLDRDDVKRDPQSGGTVPDDYRARDSD